MDFVVLGGRLSLTHPSKAFKNRWCGLLKSGQLVSTKERGRCPPTTLVALIEATQIKSVDQTGSFEITHFGEVYEFKAPSVAEACLWIEALRIAAWGDRGQDEVSSQSEASAPANDHIQFEDVLPFKPESFRPINLLSWSGTVDGGSGWYFTQFGVLVLYVVKKDGWWVPLELREIALTGDTLRPCIGTVKGAGWYTESDEDEPRFYIPEANGRWRIEAEPWTELDPCPGTTRGSEGWYVNDDGFEVFVKQDVYMTLGQREGGGEEGEQKVPEDGGKEEEGGGLSFSRNWVMRRWRGGGGRGGALGGLEGHDMDLERPQREESKRWTCPDLADVVARPGSGVHGHLITR